MQTLDLTIGAATFQRNLATGEWEALVETNPLTGTQRLYKAIDVRRERESARKAIAAGHMLRPEMRDHFVNLEMDMVRLGATLDLLRLEDAAAR